VTETHDREHDAVPLRGPLVGVSAVVVRDGQVLLGRRRGALGAGAYGFPGGKVDAGESPIAAVVRELREETGLEATRVAQITWTHDVFPEEALHFITLHHRGDIGAGVEPRLLEPAKAESWAWHSWDALPSPLFAAARRLVDAGWDPRDSASGWRSVGGAGL
jgi:8-oxo-dGTP diphosphatase